jgi:hypothetical protein
VPFQQATWRFPVAIIVLRSRSSKLSDLLLLVPNLLVTLKSIRIGDVVELRGY